MAVLLKVHIIPGDRLQFAALQCQIARNPWISIVKLEFANQ